jgi:carboxypeptidase PM20D1
MRHLACGIAAVLAVRVGAVLVQTIRVSYDLPDVGPVERAGFDADSAPTRLRAAIRYRTVSHQDSTQFDEEEFSGFISFLERAFPRVHAELQRERIGQYSLLYRWPGTDPELDPGLLMGHYDVVPVEEGTADRWTYPPYSGAIAEGFLWGRGAIDDKSGTLSQFEAAEYLLRQGYQPERTMYLLANHDEEAGGLTGAAQVADTLAVRDVELAFVVDEGLPVAEEIIPGIGSPLALVGVANKGQLTLRLTVRRDGGHSSMPPQETAIGELARAIRALKDDPMPGRFGGLVQTTFDPLSSELPFVYRMGLANLWLFRPIIENRLSRIPHTNAALRTTVAPTVFQAGLKRNMLPARADAIVNFRIHPADSIEQVVEYVRRTIDDPDVHITRLPGAKNASPVSKTDGWPYERFQQSIGEVFGEIPIAPSIFVAASDARHFTGLSDYIYRFRAFRARPADRTRIHGTNERIAVDNYAEMIQFQIRLIRNMAEPPGVKSTRRCKKQTSG